MKKLSLLLVLLLTAGMTVAKVGKQPSVNNNRQPWKNRIRKTGAVAKVPSIVIRYKSSFATLRRYPSLFLSPDI